MREKSVLSVLLQSRPKVVGRELPFRYPQPLPLLPSSSQPSEVRRHELKLLVSDGRPAAFPSPKPSRLKPSLHPFTNERAFIFGEREQEVIETYELDRLHSPPNYAFISL